MELPYSYHRKNTLIRCLLASTLVVATGTVSAITPEGKGSSSSSSVSTPAPRSNAQSTKSPQGTLPFPQTAEEMRRALGRGGSDGRAMKEFDDPAFGGFGSFIEFDSDSAHVVENQGIREVLKALREPPLEAGEHITITGHTDSDGSADYNMDLSYRRANAVRMWLIERGVRPDALRANGAGESQPIDTNTTEEGKRRNRRVEFSAKSW